jgi:hypothetical protein
MRMPPGHRPEAGYAPEVAGSLKEALAKSGLTPAESPKKKSEIRREKQKWREPLPEDESLPPLFEAPALTKPIESKPPAKKK